MLAETVIKDIERIADLFKSSKQAIAFTGAGISTESGIPDFRSPKSGLWEDVDPFQVASIYGFRRNPEAFFNWVRPLTLTTIDAEPNPAHLALAQLESCGYLTGGVITQNIDNLHTRAGTQTVYELHGHMRSATCISCFGVMDGLPIMEQFLKDGEVPLCPHCGGVMKPNVILFGEQLPVRELHAAQDAARNADLLIVVGSSLEVAPAGDIPLLAHRHGAKLVVVNLQTTPVDHLAEVVIHERAALILPEIVRRLEM